MPNEIMKFKYNSSHNSFPAIESLNPIDIGTEKQFWFTAKMLCDMFQITKPTLYSRVETLIKVGDLSVKNSLQTKMPDSRGSLHETTLYDLKVLNKLAMTMIDNPIAVGVREAFNDIITQVETTGQYNAVQLDRKTQLQLAIINSKPNSVEQLSAIAALEELHAEEKKALAAENETLTQQNDTLHTELDLIRSTMFTNKRVCEMIRERFDIKYADSTLRGKVGKALKLISNELSENIIYRKDFVDGVLRSTPYYTERTMNKLIQRLEDNPAYLKSIK